jgi:alpha,alpha-trehalose phosphorylase
MAAEVGHLSLGYDYLAEAAFMDLQDREHNTKDGLHIASLAGAWIALVGGFGGMRAANGQLSFSPKLPPGIVGLTFRMRYRGRTLKVAIRGHAATYALLVGDPLDITHHGEQATVSDKELTLDIPRIVPPPAPTQPYGRVPLPHRGRSV